MGTNDFALDKEKDRKTTLLVTYGTMFTTYAVTH